MPQDLKLLTQHSVTRPLQSRNIAHVSCAGTAASTYRLIFSLCILSLASLHILVSQMTSVHYGNCQRDPAMSLLAYPIRLGILGHQCAADTPYSSSFPAQSTVTD